MADLKQFDLKDDVFYREGGGGGGEGGRGKGG